MSKPNKGASKGASRRGKRRPGRTDGPFSARARARKRALQALYQWEIARTEPDDIVSQFVEEQDMGKVDVEYFGLLVREVVARASELDNKLAAHMDRTPAELDLLELAALRLGAFELLERIEVPYKVAINEAVELAADFGSPQSPTYVNAVLDQLSKECRQVERQAES